jgi:aldose sugar dehydrogenase
VVFFLRIPAVQPVPKEFVLMRLHPSSRKGRLRTGGLVLAALALAACGDPEPTAAQSGDVLTSEHHDFRVVTVAEGLVHPWGMAFLPGGDILVTERPGRLRIIRDGALDPNPIAGVPEVRAQGQGGLLDVVLHPDFQNNRMVYLSYSKPRNDGEEATTAVARGVFDGQALTGVEDIFVAEAWSRAGQHFGSRLAFDRDGYLFVTVGDRGNSPMTETPETHPSQTTDNHIGSILRIHDDGSVPSDNPFVGQAGYLPEIWAYGSRNAQGMIIHPETNVVWINEHGPQGGDEVNVVHPGLNFGWPVVGYGVQYGGAVIHDDTEGPCYTDPVHVWVPSIATAGKMYYTGNAFPAWQGNIFVGGMAGEQLARLTISGESVTSEETLLSGTVGRIRDVRQGPDGFIYLAIDERRGGETPILRLEPAGN